MSAGFAGHLLRRQTAEFLVNDREQVCGGFWITTLNPFQNMRELVHDPRIKASSPEIKRKRCVVIASNFTGELAALLLRFFISL